MGQARWKYCTEKNAKISPSAHHRTTLSGCIFATKADIDNRTKLLKLQFLVQMSPQYRSRRSTGGWDRFGSLGHPCKFWWVSRVGSVAARHSSSGRQPNFAASNKGRYLYSVFQRNGEHICLRGHGTGSGTFRIKLYLQRHCTCRGQRLRPLTSFLISTITKHLC